MYQIDHVTASAERPPKLPSGVGGWFTEGAVSGLVPYTVLTADFMNMLQAELLAVLGAAGVVADKGDDAQLLLAIERLAAVVVRSAQATESLRGGAKVSTQADARGLSSDEVMLTPLKMAAAYSGFRQSLTVNGYQMEPGGLIKQWGVTALLGVEDSLLVTLPIPFPSAFFGVLSVPIGVNGAGVTAAVCSPVDMASFMLYSDSSGGGTSHMFYWEARGK